MKKRAAIYIRVSTARQAEDGLSLEAQEKILRAFCEQNEMTVATKYADEGISAKDIKHRPQFLQMMTDAENGDFDVIVFWKLTRFSRSTLDLLQCCQRLNKCGVGLKSYSEPIDTTTAAGLMTTTVLGAMAQFERDMVSENVKMVMAYRANDGKRTCNEILGYDLDGKDSLTVNAAEAKIVRYIFNTFIKTGSLTQTAEMCRAKHYRGKRGAELKSCHIERILTCTVHAGYYRFHDDVHRGDFPHIISVKKFNCVQKKIEENYACVGRTRKHKLIHL